MPLKGNHANRRAALIRVSTDEQAEEGHSPDVQLSRVQAYATEAFCEPVAASDVYYELGVSGRTGDIQKRPGLQRIMDACEQGQYSHVIVHKLDRLGRNVKLMATALEHFEKHGVVFTAVQDKIDGTTAAGKLFISIFCAVSQWFSDNLSDEVKKGHEGRRRAGRTNGTAPFGAIKDPLTHIPTKDLRTITLRDGRAATPYDGLIALMEHTAQGDSPLAITTWLIEQGYTALHGGALFTRNVVRHARTNRFYLGEISDGKGGWIAGTHAPLIPQELWDRAQVAIARNQQHPRSIPKGSHHHPLGAGLLRCVGCHEKGIESALNGGFKNGSRGYGCHGRFARRSCDEPYTRAQKLEEQVAWLLEQFAFATADEERLVDLYQHIVTQDEERPDYTAQMRVLEGRMERLRKMFEWGDVDEAAYRAQARDLKQDMTHLQSQIAAMPSVEKIVDIRGLVQDAAYAWAEAEDEERQAIAQLFFERIWVKQQQIVAIEPQESLRELFTVIGGLWSQGVPHHQSPYLLPNTAIPVYVPVPNHPHTTGFRLSPDLRHAIVALRQQGTSYGIIAADFHVSFTTISKVMKTHHEGVQE